MFVYIIFNTVNTDIYIGSTSKPISQRFRAHKCLYQRTKNIPNYKDTKLYEAFSKFGVNNFYVRLLAYYPNISRADLFIKEQEAYDLYQPAYNMIRPHLSKAEKYKELYGNKSQILLKNKTYLYQLQVNSTLLCIDSFEFYNINSSEDDPADSFVIDKITAYCSNKNFRPIYIDRRKSPWTLSMEHIRKYKQYDNINIHILTQVNTARQLKTDMMTYNILFNPKFIIHDILYNTSTPTTSIPIVSENKYKSTYIDADITWLSNNNYNISQDNLYIFYLIRTKIANYPDHLKSIIYTNYCNTNPIDCQCNSCNKIFPNKHYYIEHLSTQLHKDNEREYRLKLTQLKEVGND